jgi:signal transduction histidine kinase
VLNELLNNACKYTPAQETIRLTVSLTQINVVISISNSGVEIAPTDLARIFDKFYRIPDKDPWKHGGTGLGLALVKRLVETLGGVINATSSKQCTNFVLELPITMANPQT